MFEKLQKSRALNMRRIKTQALRQRLHPRRLAGAEISAQRNDAGVIAFGRLPEIGGFFEEGYRRAHEESLYLRHLTHKFFVSLLSADYLLSV